jgi:hypothetical protein
MSRLMQSAAALLAALLVAGCGGVGDTPKLAPVEGTVTLGGEPLRDALVSFTPTGEGAPSYGRTDDNGWYELIYSRTDKGAMLGEHRVEISTYVPGDGTDEEDSVAYVAEKVPARYNVNTELKRAVETGGNVHDFELEAEGEIVEVRDDR